MKIARKLIVLSMVSVLLLSFTQAHKFYLSVTNVAYSEKDSALQITTRIFIDDFEQALEERYGFTGNLATPEEDKGAEAFIEKYLNAKLVIEVDATYKSYSFLGKTYEDDVMICYIEVPNVTLEEHKSIAIQNELLTDLFDEQQNVVHFKINGKKKSFVLIKENNKGMLNL